MFMIPLCVSGITETGEAFECPGHAVGVNRFGAHIRLQKPVKASHRVLLTNLENNQRGEFRIIRKLDGAPAGKADLGVEALGNYPTFWGIGFPAKPRKQGESRGLLECRQCGSATLHPLLLDEIEMLESGGSIKKPCMSCGAKTQWEFAMEGAKATLPEPGLASPEEESAAADNQQGKPIIYMQRPVSIRTASGEVETVLTENLSKNEIRCSSKKSYEVNQVVTLEWESTGTGQRIQMQGRIRRRQSIAGSPRVIYSIRIEGQTASLPPAPLKSAGRLYAATAVLMVAASILLVVNVRGLVFSLTFPYGSITRRVAYLGTVLLLVLLAHKAWKTILAREPENRQRFRKRHRVIAWVVAAVFLGSLGVGVIDGVARGYQRRQTLKVLHDLAMIGIFENNIDAAENRVTHSPTDYADACATLALLASGWQAHMDELSADAAELNHVQLWQKPTFQKEMNALQKIIALDRRKLHLVQQQVALKDEAQRIDPDRKPAFWQLQFTPLRHRIGNLDREKKQVVKAPVAEK